MILKNEILIPKEKDEYMEVRTLAIKGSDYQIGKDLAEIGIENYDIKLDKYDDPIYKKARQSYMQQNFPSLAERARGVADAFKLDPNDNIHDTTSLFYDVSDIACSAIYFPASLTENNHPCVCRVLDWYKASVSEMKAKKIDTSGKSGRKSLSRVVSVEAYPDDGYNTIQVGAHDLLNPPMDGINEKGLFVSILTDMQGKLNTDVAFGGSKDAGLSFPQLTSMILNKCATVEEAKVEILQQRVYFPFRTVHYLIGDLEGNVTVFEVDAETGLYHFTDGKANEPFILTNHALHLYPDPSTYPDTNPNESRNTFNRWHTLNDFVQEHEGVFTKEDMFDALSLVYAHFGDPKAAGQIVYITERTMFAHVTDLAEQKIEIKFYSKDGPSTDGSVNPSIIFHDPVTLAMQYD